MIKSLNQPIDLTVGTPWKGLLKFTLPMLIGNIAQQLYSTVDSIVVGKYIGDNALAAVGSALPIVNLFLVLFIGISAGASIMVAQYVGAKNRESLSHTIGSSITATAVAGVILIAAVLPFLEKIVLLLKTPSEIQTDCYNYLAISLIGIMGMAYYNILSGLLRGLGDSFAALVYLLVATVINVFLDIYFVADWGLNIGVPGVALATIIAQVISSILCYIRLTKMKEYYDFGVRYLKPKAFFIKTLVKLGLPAGLTQAIFSSAMIVVQSLTNQFGAELIAANVIVMRVDGFAMMPNFSFGTALTTYAGQNIGAKKLDRVKQGAKQGTLMAVLCSATVTLVILIFGKYLMGMFTDTPELIEKSRYIMTILAAGYIAVAVTQSLSGIMRGAGDTMTPMWLSLITTVIIRVPLAYGISYLTATEELTHGRFECIPVSLLVSWLIGALLTVIFYRFGNWKKKAIN